MKIPSMPTHAVHRVDNWDGQEDIDFCLAFVGDDGEFYDFETGAKLVTYEGDKILKAILLDWSRQ